MGAKFGSICQILCKIKKNKRLRILYFLFLMIFSVFKTDMKSFRSLGSWSSRI